jgi:small subunit ribosomal protein S22
MQERCIAIREPDGTLRLANQEEKDRIFNVYYPRPGKAPKMPKMFEEQSIEV